MQIMDWRSMIGRSRELAVDTAAGWSKYECSTQAAAISYYAALSLFPLVIVLISGVGMFFESFESGVNSQAYVLDALSELFSPEMSAAVADILAEVQTQARIGGPIAFVVLLYLSSRVFAQIDRAFVHIWEVKAKAKKGLRFSAKLVLFNRLRSLALMVGMGGIVILVFFGSTAVYAVGNLLDVWFPEAKTVWNLRSYLLSLGTSAIVFAGIYHFLSREKIRWALCFVIGLLVALLWEIGRVVLAGIVIGENYSALGVVGSFLAILVWIFYNSLALLSGAILIRVMTAGPEHQ